MDIDKILNGNIWTIWCKFIVASVVGVVLTALYTMVDGIFVGQGVGEAGLASINLAWPAVTILLGVGALLGIGAGSVISIHLGKKQKNEAEIALGTVIKTSIYIGAVLTVIGLLVADPVVKFLGASEDTFAYTKDYYQVVYIMAIPYIFSNALNPIVRADGRPQLSMAMIGVGAICNIILDWLFVIVLGWGIKGAAWATGASVILSTLCGLYYFTLGKSHIKLCRKYFKVNKEVLKEIVKVGFVCFAMQVSVGAILLLQNNVIYSLGTTSDIAIYSVAGYIISLYTQVSLGIAQGMQPLIGYHYGGTKYKRMHHILWITIGVCGVLGIVAFMVLLVFGEGIIGVFGLEMQNMSLAYKRVLIFCMGMPAIGVVYTMGSYYQAIGKNLYANVISIGRGFVLQVCFTLLFAYAIGVEGVFYAQSVSDVVAIVILGVIIFYDRLRARESRIHQGVEVISNE